MGNIPKPNERKRAHRRIRGTVASRGIFKLFVKPFLKHFALPEEHSAWKQGIEAFFNVNERPIMWCKATETFKLPGEMWVNQSQPTKRIAGTGNRIVTRGAPLVVRLDLTVSNKNEIEFREQVFVLTDAEYNAIKDKLKPII
jgi:hypothetical protein